MKYLFIIVAVAVAGLILFTGTNRQERTECARWQALDASQLAKWQFDQCQHQGIHLGQ